MNNSLRNFDPLSGVHSSRHKSKLNWFVQAQPATAMKAKENVNYCCKQSRRRFVSVFHEPGPDGAEATLSFKTNSTAHAAFSNWKPPGFNYLRINCVSLSCIR